MTELETLVVGPIQASLAVSHDLKGQGVEHIVLERYHIIAMPEEIDLSDFGTVLFTGGYQPDYKSWRPRPEAFDENGFAIQKDGTKTVVDGLHFVGPTFRVNASRLFSWVLGKTPES